MEITPLKISELLKKYSLRPTKGLGQNFLIDESALKKIVYSAGINNLDTVLEIGPGLGSLTRHLAISAKQVIAIEIDSTFIDPLSEILEPNKNVKVIHDDILKVDIDKLFTDQDYIVVANIPYYITSALLRHLLESKSPPSRIILTVQKEVAQRICELPGKLSLLALSVQVFGKPTIVAKIPAGSFYPRPNVDSAVVRIELYKSPKIPADNLDLFFKLIKAGFSQKRKMLRNTLTSGMHWEKKITEEKLLKAEIDPDRRAQTLSLEEWGKLVKTV